MLSQSVPQQYGSAAHTLVTHALHPSVSGAPVEQSECEHAPGPPLELPLLDPLLEPLLDPLLLPELLPLLPPELLPPLQLPPQIVFTSPTQMLSHFTVQQYESAAQISPAHVLHVFTSLMPVEQTLCEHEPVPASVPPLLLPLDEPLLLPELLPLELPLLDPLLLPELPPLELPLPPESAAPFGVPMPVGPS